MMMRATNRQSGISIVEIMVGIALSLILLAGVMQIFLTNKQTYRVQEAFSRLQENGRYAMEFLSKDLRMAGFFGCASAIDEPENLVDFDKNGTADAIAGFTGNGLSGFEHADLPLVLNSTTNLTAAEVLPNTDIIQIKRGTNTGLYIADPALRDDAAIQLDPVLAAGMFAEDDVLFVTDCEAADIFAATGVGNGGGYVTISHANDANLGPKLSKVYQQDAEVMKMVSHLYYLGTNSAGVPALFRASLGNNGAIITEELVEGVEDLQLMYGEDTNDDGVVNVYVDSAAVADFTKVLNIRLTVTVRTIEDNIASQITAAGDKRLRRTFTTSVTIRNRVI
ncbi:MAG: PilW family protein [Gammaproteobacteria bacterium]